MDLAAITDDLFRRAAASDGQGMVELCAPGCSFRQNGGPDLGADGLIALVDGLAGAGITTAYSDVRRVVADDALVEQHLVTLTRSDGVAATGDVCVVLRFDGSGAITGVDEYLDSAAFAALLA